MSPLAACVLSACLLGEPPVLDDSSTSLDRVISAEWSAQGVVPESMIDDATFLRRVWLDLAGRVPPLGEVEKFLAAREQGKRSDLVERLLASPEFATHWARSWTEYLTDERPFAQETYDALVLQAWLRDALAEGKSYRQIVFDLLTGSGASDESGPANFFLKYDVEPIQLAGAVSRKFLGLTLQCAQCHDHPHAKWQKEDFWGLAAYFGRLRRMEPAEDDEPFSLVVERTRGELQIPDMDAKPNEDGEIPQRSVFPRLPGGKYVDSAPRRREALSAWVTAGENPYFARHAVNRVWQQVYGTSLGTSFDKLSDEPPSSRKAILDHLTAEFLKHNTDLKWLIRTIVLSQTYQRGSGTKSVTGPKSDELRVRQVELFARSPVRPLSADQLYLSVVQVTRFRGSEEAARVAETTKQDFVTDLPNETFYDQPLSVHRALSLLNGEYLRSAIAVATQSALQKFGDRPGVEHIRWLFLAALSRPPTAEEVEQLLDLVAAGEGGFEDAVWVVLNSAEFNSNH